MNHLRPELRAREASTKSGQLHSQLYRVRDSVNVKFIGVISIGTINSNGIDIDNETNGSLILGCRIDGNNQRNSVGLLIDGTNGNATTNVIGCIFENWDVGIRVASRYSTRLVAIRDCYFESNLSYAIAIGNNDIVPVSSGDNVTIDHCYLKGNASPASTSGVYAIRAVGLRITDCYGLDNLTSGAIQFDANVMDYWAENNVVGDSEIVYDINTAARAGKGSCRATRTSSLAVSSATPTIVDYTSADFDTGAFHSTTVNPSRLTIQRSGKYSVIGSIAWAGNASGIRRIRLLKNGVVLTPDQYTQQPTGGTTVADVGQTVATFLDLRAGDYLQVEGYQDSGGTLNIEYGTFAIAMLSDV